MANRFFSPLLGLLPKNLAEQLFIYFNVYKEKFNNPTASFTDFKFTNSHKTFEVASEVDIAIQNELQTTIHNMMSSIKEQNTTITFAPGCNNNGFYLAFANLCKGVQKISKKENASFKTNEIAIYFDDLDLTKQDEIAKAFDTIDWPNMITRDGSLSISLIDMMGYSETYYFNNITPEDYKDLNVFLTVVYKKDTPKYAQALIKDYITATIAAIRIGQSLYQENFFNMADFPNVAEFIMTSSDTDHTSPISGIHPQEIGQKWKLATITIVEQTEASSLKLSSNTYNMKKSPNIETSISTVSNSQVSNISWWQKLSIRFKLWRK